MRKTEPHQKLSSSQPPSSGPTGKLTNVAEAMIAIALGRSSAVNSTGSIERESGRIAAAPSPSSARAAISSPDEVDRAHRAELTPNSTSAPSNTFLRPSRSPSSPAGSTAAAITRLYASENHCRSLVDACSERESVGSARLRTVRSSPTTSTLAAMATRAHHRRESEATMTVTSFRMSHAFDSSSQKLVSVKWIEQSDCEVGHRLGRCAPGHRRDDRAEPRTGGRTRPHRPGAGSSRAPCTRRLRAAVPGPGWVHGGYSH